MASHFYPVVCTGKWSLLVCSTFMVNQYQASVDGHSHTLVAFSITCSGKYFLFPCIYVSLKLCVMIIFPWLDFFKYWKWMLEPTVCDWQVLSFRMAFVGIAASHMCLMYNCRLVNALLLKENAINFRDRSLRYGVLIKTKTKTGAKWDNEWL